MSGAGKVIVGIGAVGVAAGVGYLIWRHVKKKRARDKERAAQTGASAKAEDASHAIQGQGHDEAAATAELPAPAAEGPARQSTPAPEATPEPPAPEAAPAPAPRPAPMLESLPGPRTPLDEPAGALAFLRINTSHTDDDGTVKESADELLVQARTFDRAITLDELTGARLAASEHHGGTMTELACIVDSELNRAERRGMTLFESLTYRGTFGKQGRKRRASTRQDPKMRHVMAARAVLSGKARGVSRGADRFFDPRAMESMNARYRAWLEGGQEGEQPAHVSCDALTLLEAWSYDLGRQGSSRCPPDRNRRGRDTLAWVGPIPGVDPLRLMLMKPQPVGAMHTRHYEAAREVLRAGLGRK